MLISINVEELKKNLNGKHQERLFQTLLLIYFMFIHRGHTNKIKRTHNTPMTSRSDYTSICMFSLGVSPKIAHWAAMPHNIFSRRQIKKYEILFIKT